MWNGGWCGGSIHWPVRLTVHDTALCLSLWRRQLGENNSIAPQTDTLFFFPAKDPSKYFEQSKKKLRDIKRAKHYFLSKVRNSLANYIPSGREALWSSYTTFADRVNTQPSYHAKGGSHARKSTKDSYRSCPSLQFAPFFIPARRPTISRKTNGGKSQQLLVQDCFLAYVVFCANSPVASPRSFFGVLRNSLHFYYFPRMYKVKKNPPRQCSRIRCNLTSKLTWLKLWSYRGQKPKNENGTRYPDPPLSIYPHPPTQQHDFRRRRSKGETAV